MRRRGVVGRVKVKLGMKSFVYDMFLELYILTFRKIREFHIV